MLLSYTSGQYVYYFSSKMNELRAKQCTYLWKLVMIYYASGNYKNVRIAKYVQWFEAFSARAICGFVNKSLIIFSKWKKTSQRCTEHSSPKIYQRPGRVTELGRGTTSSMVNFLLRGAHTKRYFTKMTTTSYEDCFLPSDFIKNFIRKINPQ